MTEALIRELGRLLPHWTFLLLTSEAGHAEAVSRLQSSNIRCMCVERQPAPARHGWLHRAGRGVLRRHGGLARIWAQRLRHSIPGRRPISQSAPPPADSELALLSSVGADILFCPFGQFRMPSFQDPRVPTVSVIYDLQFLTYPQFFSESDLAFRTSAYTRACERSDALVCISDATRQRVLETADVAPSSVSTIHIRTKHDTGSLSGSRGASSEVLARLGVEPGKFFLYPANLWRHKNHEVLLTAVNKIVRRDPDWDFKVVCSGAGLGRLEELRALAASLGVGSRVLFTGFLPRADLDTLLTRCRGLVYPSLYEGFGIPLLEAMRAHKPIACSNVTSLPEVGADAVLLFDPTRPGEVAQALQRLSQDSDLIGELTQRGVARADDFGDSERMAREYLALFVDVLSGQVRRSTTAVHGVWSDGWAGGSVVVSLAAREESGELHVSLTLPPWVPTRTLDVSITSSYALGSGHAAIEQGTTRDVCIPVGREGGWVELRLSPLFCPSTNGVSTDSRWLGAMCDGIRLRTDGRITELAALAS